MKINEVPQDQGFMIEGKIRDVCYAVDENGHYTKKLSTGWNPKNEAMVMAWDVVYERVEDVRSKILAGELSPIAFYMELNVMDVAILADYTGISKFKVKKHLKMKKFKELETEVLEKYASTFNLSVEELKDVERIKNFQLKTVGCR
jgi:Cro/C1-type HTH DNA-binding domain